MQEADDLTVDHANPFVDAAILSFCDRFRQHTKRSETLGSGRWLQSACGHWLVKHPANFKDESLHVLWFMMGNTFARCGGLCYNLVQDIDISTATAIEQDKVELLRYKAQIAALRKGNLSAKKKELRTKRLQRSIAGKERMILQEARKVDLLYSLLGTQKRRARQRKTQGRPRIRVKDLTSPSMWDSGFAGT